MTKQELLKEIEALRAKLEEMADDKEPGIKPGPKRVPMSPTTCPDGWWGIRRKSWGEDMYRSVIGVDKYGAQAISGSGYISTIRWEILMSEGWHIYEGRGKPSRPCSVEVRG